MNFIKPLVSVVFILLTSFAFLSWTEENKNSPLAASSATNCSGQVVESFPNVNLTNGSINVSVSQSGTAVVLGVEFQGASGKYTFPQKISDGLKKYSIPPGAYIFRIVGTMSYFKDQYGRIHCGEFKAEVNN